MNEEIKNKLRRGLALTVKESWDLYKYIEALEQIESISNKSEILTGWIPCAERLPEKEGYYLVTATNHFTGKIGVFISWLETDIYEDGKWGSEWCNNYTENTIAWMPLPQPYKTENEEEK